MSTDRRASIYGPPRRPPRGPSRASVIAARILIAVLIVGSLGIVGFAALHAFDDLNDDVPDFHYVPPRLLDPVELYIPPPGAFNFEPLQTAEILSPPVRPSTRSEPPQTAEILAPASPPSTLSPPSTAEDRASARGPARPPKPAEPAPPEDDPGPLQSAGIILR